MGLSKFKDEFGQEWTSWAGAAEVDPMTRRLMVAEAISDLRRRKARGGADANDYISTFVQAGEALYTIEIFGDDRVAVHSCKVLAHTWDYK